MSKYKMKENLIEKINKHFEILSSTFQKDLVEEIEEFSHQRDNDSLHMHGHYLAKFEGHMKELERYHNTVIELIKENL